MDKERSPGLPPMSNSRYSLFPSPAGGTFPGKTEGMSVGTTTTSQRNFSHDVSKMPDFPQRKAGHRRARSEIVSLPDDISFESDLGVVGCNDGPSLSDENEDDIVSMYMDMEKFGWVGGEESGDRSAGGANTVPVNPVGGVAIGSSSSVIGPSSSNGMPRFRHQHSQSMDGSTSIKPEMLASGPDGPSLAEEKKAISAAKLADLALVDPKRAKRIWANRQSAARSKERKMRYISELERKVQTLQTEATTLSAQLTMLQRDTTGLTSENSELKLRLQTIEQQVHLQDALNDALREEVQRLKMITGQAITNGGQLFNYGCPSFSTNQKFYPQNHNMQSLLATHQLQQLNLHSQQQLHPNQLQHRQHSSTEVKIRPPPPPPVAPTQNNQDNSSDVNTVSKKE